MTIQTFTIEQVDSLIDSNRQLINLHVKNALEAVKSSDLYTEVKLAVENREDINKKREEKLLDISNNIKEWMCIKQLLELHPHYKIDENYLETEQEMLDRNKRIEAAIINTVEDAVQETLKFREDYEIRNAIIYELKAKLLLRAVESYEETQQFIEDNIDVNKHLYNLQ